ncbi:MAG: protein kinase [Deltaproteobacteria bacterium]|nr:protein kinase [Deltaproteobacteria bacterium]
MATTTTTSSSSRSRKDTLLGKVIAGRYRLEARLGEGGMGVVYRARHVLIDRVVALKLIRPDLRGETHLRAWMLREARAANRVDHAHIVDIHDVGETEDGELYLVMEYLVGASLSSQIAKGPMPIPRAVDIIEQMTAALSRAHDLGVIHRDLKSDNIMLTQRGGRQDYVKILDFGLAALARDPRLAPKGAVFGTPEYMSPEQARGEDAIASSDLYALGILFYEMTTGQLPFRSSDRETLLEMQRSGATKNPRTLREDLPDAAEHIILRLLQKKADDRFRDGHHLQEELKAFQRSLPSTAWDRATQDAPQGPPPPPPAQSTGVAEWSKRAANFLRLVSRAYPNGRAPENISNAADKVWDLAARASKLEGELASHAKKLEAIERRGRALRAEIGRKVEELSHEESSLARRAAEERDRARRIQRAIAGAQEAQQASAQRVQQVQQAGGDMATLQQVFEESGGLAGRVHALSEVLKEHDAKATRQEQQAESLRKQVTDLRAQLQRYGDALESDLTAGRERIATRVREALSYEKSFTDASGTLVDHLKGKAECRELLEEVRKDMAQHHSLGTAPSKVPVVRRDSWVVKS